MLLCEAIRPMRPDLVQLLGVPCCIVAQRSSHAYPLLNAVHWFLTQLQASTRLAALPPILELPAMQPPPEQRRYVAITALDRAVVRAWRSTFWALYCTIRTRRQLLSTPGASSAPRCSRDICLTWTYFSTNGTTAVCALDLYVHLLVPSRL